MNTNELTPRMQARKLYEDFIGLAHDGITSCEENAIEIAIICAKYVKNNSKNEDKTYWLDVIHELKVFNYED